MNNQRGFSMLELLVVIAIMLTLASVAIPSFHKAQMNSRELAAIRQIQTIHTAQIQYFSQFGRFAPSLHELGPEGSELVPPPLAGGHASGYVFSVRTAPEGYAVNADPEAYKSTGRRSFYSDQMQVIREHWGREPATKESGPIQ